MSKILVITDKEDDGTLSLEKGMYLASCADAKLEVIAFCFENLPDLSAQTGRPEDELKKDILAFKERVLEEKLRKVLAMDKRYRKLEVSTEVVWEQNVSDWVSDLTSLVKYDFVVKTGHRSEGFFYTPTDWRLIRTSRAPVYLRSDKAWKKKGGVLIALDVENSSAAKQKMNHQILEAGRSLADTLQVELYCCFVISIPTILRELDLVDKSEYVKKAREEYLPKVAEMVEHFGIPKSHIYRAVGEPSGKIIKIASKLKVGCVVIGSIGRKGISGRLFGNTAERVIRHLYSDMLVINLV